MELREVKETIYHTDCIEYMYDTLECSEPIMSLDESGKIIDNYIVFPRDITNSIIGAPIVKFGIYTSDKIVAYVDESVFDLFDQVVFEEHYENAEIRNAAFDDYSSLFPIVREMFEKKRIRDQDAIDSYMLSLNKYSGTVLFSMYKKLFPRFFEWVGQ